MKHKELLFGLVSLILVVLLFGFYLSGKTSTLVVPTPTPATIPSPEITASDKKNNSTRTSCRTDDDCMLINKNLGFACCYVGACQDIDYSKPEWVAVNSDWYYLQREKSCPSEEECGPAPGCPSQIINDDFAPRCLNGICQKRSLSSPQSTTACGFTTCHGLDFSCGAKIPEACTTIYMMGDRCRQYASCQVIDSRCQLVKDTRFETCKSCVKKCQAQFPNDPLKLSSCESRCGD